MSMFDSNAANNGHCLNMTRRIFIFFATAALLAPSSASHSPTALPKPYQPGNSRRHWPHEKPQGIARKSSILCVDLREAGREPMFNAAISAIGVEAKKYSVKPGVS